MAKHTDPITKRLSENIVHARKIYGLSQAKRCYDSLAQNLRQFHRHTGGLKPYGTGFLRRPVFATECVTFSFFAAVQG